MGLLTTVNRQTRSVRECVRGLTDTAHPLLVQIIPIRRCNIDCGYCNEYDKVSPPVPTELMKGRIDRLAALGTSVVAFTGCGPMPHPPRAGRAGRAGGGAGRGGADAPPGPR